MENTLHQKIMDEAYSFWQSQEKMDYVTFIDSLDKKQKLAVLTGNLNYQVENGGFSQWHINEYSKKAKELIELLTPLEGIEVVKEVIELVETAIDIIEEFDRPEGSGFDEDEEYYDEYHDNEMHSALDSLDTRYYSINEKFLNIIEEVLK